MHDIYIPYAGEPLDMLRRTLGGIDSARVNPIVIDNSHAQLLRGESGLPVMAPPAPLTLWQTMWMLCQNRQPFLWTQCDAVLDPGSVDRLLDSVAELRKPWGIVFTLYDTLSAVNAPELVERNVLPDLNIPHYHGDPDWYARMRLAGLETVQASNEGVRHEPGGGAHWRHSPERDLARQCFDSARYYRAKWGGEVGHEVYKTPWNS